MSGPAPGDWRQQANPKATPAAGGNAKQGKRAWQSQTEAVKGPRKPVSRGSKLLMASLALSVVIGGVIAVVLWLRPAKPATLILLGASYDDNLTLPHNLYTWRSILDLEEVAGSQSLFTQSGKISRAHGPVDLRATNWEKEWAKVPTRVKEESVILVLGLHGSVRDGKAFLHLDDDRGVAGVTVEQLLKDLAASPLAKKNVLLVLEPALNRANWATGMLHNDFVSKLKDLDKQIADQPNLLVLCASDVNQVSWASEEWRRTIFMHYLIEGLQGAADTDDQRVTAYELFQFAHNKVQAWSQANRGVLQTPLLLGGEGRAKNISLVQVATRYKERTPDDAPGKSFPDNPDLETAWRTLASLRDMVPSPAVYTPQLWRVYQELTLRYEHLIRAGYSAQKIGDMKTRLKDLEKTIRTKTSLESAATVRQHSLPMSAALGMRPNWKDEDLRQQFQVLWDARKGEKLTELLAANKSWAATQSPALEAKDAEKLLSVDLYRQMMRQLSSSKVIDPADISANGACKLAKQIEDSYSVDRPAEIHYLAMLSQDLDSAHPPALKDLQFALEVRLQAEQAALGMSSSQNAHPYAEVVFPRLKKKVEEGDEARRLGEDWLFGSQADDWKQATEYFTTAKEKYGAALATAATYQQALDARDRAFADLPFLAQWLANQRFTIDKGREREMETLQGKVDLVADRAREIHKRLADEGDSTADLRAMTAQLTQEHKDLKAAFAKECEDLTAEVHLLPRWHEIDAVLSVPLVVDDGKDPASARMQLLRNSRTTSAKFHLGGLESKTPLIPQDQEAAMLVKSIVREKRLARASLMPFITFATPDDPIQKHLLQMVDTISQSLRTSLETPDLKKASEELVKTDLLCRGLPGGLEKLTPREPFAGPEALRRLRTHDLLLWQAERTLRDHWYAEKESTQKTYYEPSARACIKTAQHLVEEGIQEKDLRIARESTAQKLLDQVRETGLDKPGDAQSSWTTERKFPIRWPVKPQDDPFLRPLGVGMFTVESAGGKKAEASPKRTYWKSWDSDVKHELADKIAAETSVRLHMLYRGQQIEPLVKVTPASPDRIDYQFPPGDKAGIAVRMDRDFTYGAISIMLDCSGSMTEKYKNGTRFDQAANALDKLLAIIPKNTYVSLTIFIKTASDPQPKFQLLREPEEWKREHAAQVMTLVRNMGKQIDATGASPIARGMVKAMEQGFPDASRNYSGPRLLVALTDGDDNFSFGKFARNAEHNQEVKNLLLSKFRDSGVKAHVICFLDPNSKDAEVQREARNAEEQFSVLTNRKFFDPVGTFVLQPDGDKLAEELKNAIRPRFKFVKNVEIEKFVGEPDRELQWHAVSPGKHQLSLEGEDKIDVQLAAGERLLVTLKRRTDKKLLYERTLMRNYADIKLGEKEQPPTLVSLFQNHQTLQDNRLHQLVSFEDLTKRSWLAHRAPEFAWIETKVNPEKSKPSDKAAGLLECYRDNLYPAPCYRLRTRTWPLNNPSEVRAWWTNEDVFSQPWSKAFDVAAKGDVRKPVEIAKTTYQIEDVVMEERELAPGFDESPVRKSCLVVRLQHPPGKPVRIQLTNDHEGEEHHTFSAAGKYTAFFWGVNEGERWNLNLIALDEFKKTAENALFRPDLSPAAPQAVPLK